MGILISARSPASGPHRLDRNRPVRCPAQELSGPLASLLSGLPPVWGEALEETHEGLANLTLAFIFAPPRASCSPACRTADLTQPGRHVKTGRPIEPMAPSVNPKRPRDPEKVEKWLLRNCRWTLGHECTGEAIMKQSTRNRGGW